MQANLERRTRSKSRARHISKEAKEESKSLVQEENSETQIDHRSKNRSHGFKIKTKKQIDHREEDEICPKHNAPLIVLSQLSGEMMCEKCIYKYSKDFQPIFNSTIAKDIKKQYVREYDSLQENFKKFENIETKEVRDRIQLQITKYFDSFRNKIDDLESKAVKKIQESTNLDQLIKTIDAVNNKIDTDNFGENYEETKKKIQDMSEKVRYAYIVRRREMYKKDIESMRKYNTMLVTNIDSVNRLIESIFEVSLNEDRIAGVLNALASDMMLIDQAKPDFGDKDESSKSVEKAIEDFYSVTPVKHDVSRSQSDEPLLSEQMNAHYYPNADYLCCQEIEDGVVTNAKIMPLKLHLQKVITLPTKEGNDVYLLGGARDSNGTDAIANCYKVDLDSKTLISIEKLSTPKCAFAAGISIDCTTIFVAGGSAGCHKAINTCQMYKADEEKWIELKELNCPRFSASLISCPNNNLYVFSGIENNPTDPAKFITLKSIEHLDYSEVENDWETLSIKVPFKTSSPGAICINEDTFLVFGGWDQDLKDDAAIIWKDPKHGWYSDKMEKDKCLREHDSFLDNGLMLRDKTKKTCLVFGATYAHIYNENERKFETLNDKN